ncbi:MAG: trypsin-like peptidase domain-containing protein [Saprospiraceae bacterium]|nr:trypsin-like peptidase domain-containing protein [Saprospiraceae bacterium]
MREIIERYKGAVIQIATPFSVGTGFYLADEDLIVTNEHVVRNNKEVVIEAKGLKRMVCPVVFIDTRFDLAFIKIPQETSLTIVRLGDSEKVREGDIVLAAGHPFGLKYTATQGIISNTNHMQGEIRYIQHDAALNPGNSGGPLIDHNGRVVGVNTFIIKNGQNIGFSLPSKYLIENLEDFKKGFGKSAVRCSSCNNMVFEPNPEKKYCPHCGASISMLSDIKTYEPKGLRKTLENALEKLGYDIRLTRRGPFNWEFAHGTANIILSYHEESGMIEADSFLASLPKENIGKIYSYLLQQNNLIRGLCLGVKENEIFLSLVMFDQFIDEEILNLNLKNLLEAADHYDDELKSKFGALMIKN